LICKHSLRENQQNIGVTVELRRPEHVGIVQSLLTTCRLHDIDPYEYFVDVLQRVKNHPPLQIGELTPRRWKELFANSPKRSVLYLIDQMRKNQE
jgi:transposase